MVLTKNAIRDLYRERAGAYDISANLYYLIGFREARFRKQAISRLGIKEGDTVVEIGCGTGLNFRYVMPHIGTTGKLVGVDLTDSMLEKARQRVVSNDWQNVDLVNADASQYAFPANTNAVYSTFALTLIPEFEDVIANAARALTPGGRLVILDLKQPERWPLWAVKIGVLLTRPFGVSLDLAVRKPWIAMEKYFANVTVQELYGGFAYIAVGEK